jgi:hypothetical protein
LAGSLRGGLKVLVDFQASQTPSRGKLLLNKFRVFLIGLMAAFMVAITGVSAQAATVGNNVYVPPRSMTGVVVRNNANVDGYLARNYSTKYDPTFANKVQGFYFKAGCSGRSQYSGSTYPYKGGVYYPISVNNAYLYIETTCPI